MQEINNYVKKTQAQKRIIPVALSAWSLEIQTQGLKHNGVVLTINYLLLSKGTH